MGRRALVLLLAMTSLAAVPTPAPAPKVVTSGRVRAYDFARSYRTGPTNTQASAIGVKLHLETAAHPGIGFGLTYYHAQPFGIGGIVPAEREPSLPAVALDTLAEAYAQYSAPRTLARLGRQALQTPFANPADSRLIPVTFEGIGLTQRLGRGATLSAYRIYRAKNRTVASFTPVSFVTTVPTGGFSAIGLTRTSPRGSLQLWAYHFDRLSSLFYADATAALPPGRVWHVAGSAQVATETALADGVLGPIAASHLYGARVSAGTRALEFALSYDRVPSVPGDGRGALLSPYTFGDNADPLYTTLIGASLVEKASPGQAYVLSATFSSPDKRFKASIARGRFDLLTSLSVPKNELYESDVDLAYDLMRPSSSSDPHGLWIHERFFVQDTTLKPYTYQQNRLFIDYTW